MARRKKEECKSVPAWLTSFSDLMSLLLTFFILLYSMSTLDITKAMKFLSYFQGEKAQTFQQISIVKPIQIYTTDLAKKIKKIIKQILPIYGYQIVVTENYVLIRLFNKVLFKQNSLELTPEAKRALDQIAKIIKNLKGNYMVRVEGHTSKDEPTVPMPNIQDSWDLSIRRATTVVRYLISRGVDPSRLMAVGYDATRPLYTWNNPILQARNRRVEIYIQVAVPREEEGKKVEFKRKEKLPGGNETSGKVSSGKR
ncbi:OmpA/MotB family protein [Thermovibrio ammonificans]|uniref:OmpA/MotB domain protein n=1 Tax=Thermovibrio ammonificans (strain DSM 15698 / JCM 12110 / HB-1) TaxID=648996 RepID=E8T2F7_THEA1|nr:flagellar motor protein MotB [Thermovibrio ammonificans]ADU97052.1 OmpA/MotB domain protein [Thermovibrio ammonificans HB-1]